MEELQRESLLWRRKVSGTIERGLYGKIHWGSSLIGITGARGTGKTTLMLQRLEELDLPSHKGIYVPLDHIWFSEKSLSELIEQFRAQGGTHLFLDEVHKYPRWAKEIKQAHDLYPELQIVFSGSSVIDLRKADADLSRRAVLYDLPGLSFREYLHFQGILEHPPIELDELLEEHERIALDISEKMRPLEHFPLYLQQGYYPIFKEDPETYPIRIRQVVDQVLNGDLRFIKGFDPANTPRIARLLYILAAKVPFKPNISRLADHIGIYRNTLAQYLKHLEKARLTENLYHQEERMSSLRKPDKILLQNPNLHYALRPERADRGSVRESFFSSQLRSVNKLSLAKDADFRAADHYVFEVGGRNKGSEQLPKGENAFLALDDLESGSGKRIPLWLFGFLY